MNYLYSNDNGASWHGPVSESELAALQSAGQISESALIRAIMDTPPPPPNTVVYYAMVDGVQTGPMTKEELSGKLRQGAVKPETLVWTAGLPGWVPAKDVLGGTDSVAVNLQGVADSLAHLVGVEKMSNFSAKRFFGGIFKRHSFKEMEEFFCCGGPKSTPTPDTVRAEWPSPWIFSRVFLLGVVLLLAFVWLAEQYTIGGVGILITLNFIVPFAMLVLFAEMNVRRDVSWFRILCMLFLGGVCSLIFTTLLNNNIGSLIESPVWAGPVEETAKLATCLLVAGSTIRRGGVLQGLVCGAAVGAGFAIPESIDYFFRTMANTEAILVEMVQSGQIQISESEAQGFIGRNALSNSLLRAAYAPIAHVVYTPIVAAAMWRLMHNTGFSFDKFKDMRFWRLALVGVFLHMFWNSSLLDDDLHNLKVIIVAIMGWTVLLLLINEGIAGVRKEQQEKAGNGKEPETNAS